MQRCDEPVLSIKSGPHIGLHVFRQLGSERKRDKLESVTYDVVGLGLVVGFVHISEKCQCQTSKVGLDLPVSPELSLNMTTKTLSKNSPQCLSKAKQKPDLLMWIPFFRTNLVQILKSKDWLLQKQKTLLSFHTSCKKEIQFFSDTVSQYFAELLVLLLHISGFRHFGSWLRRRVFSTEKECRVEECCTEDLQHLMSFFGFAFGQCISHPF